MTTLAATSKMGYNIAKDCYRNNKSRFVILLISFIIIMFILFHYAIPHINRSKMLNSQFTYKYYSDHNHCDHFVSSGVEGFAKVRAGNNLYKVHEDLENPEKAAQIMDQLNTTALTMIEHLQSKYLKQDNANLIKSKYQKRVVESIARLKKNYRTTSLEENIPERSGGDTSFVIDKGDVFAMCLRDPKRDNKLDDKMNDLVFVLLHEMTHLASSSWGHDKLFWHNFKFILQEAIEAGLYNPVNYKKKGTPYCGIVITYSPLYDLELDDYHVDTQK